MTQCCMLLLILKSAHWSDHGDNLKLLAIKMVEELYVKTAPKRQRTSQSIFATNLFPVLR